MNEDVRYRTSTQYRLWSYTVAALAEQRVTTNRIATERVKAAFARARKSSGENTEDGDSSGKDKNAPDDEVNCLTPEEEMKLLVFYCKQAIALGDHLKLPTDVKATAIQYLKRFYITNSTMTYHPALILKTSLYFSTKTENHYFKLSSFCEHIGKTKEEDILASEFLLTQGLRFTFDVRHPSRPLEGAVMEMQALSGDDTVSIPALPGQDTIMEENRPDRISSRAKMAHGRAKEILKTSALLTDVYFHYTPSQIMFASLLIADTELTTWYLSIKLPMPTLLHSILANLERCRKMLESVSTAGESEAELKELKALNKKLQKCRNPESKDLVSLERRRREEAAGVKRENGEEMVDEKVLKKRKLERQGLAREGEDLFGPSLKKA